MQIGVFHTVSSITKTKTTVLNPIKYVPYCVTNKVLFINSNKILNSNEKLYWKYNILLDDEDDDDDN